MSARAMSKIGEVTMKGNPLTLTGKNAKVGDQAPDAILNRNDLSEARLSDYMGQGRRVLLVTVPSLDTSVCDRETRRFNEEAAKLPGTTVLVVSMDLPFAQQRWCGAAGIENVETLSDHARADLAEEYGVMVEELRLLARAVFVIDGEGRIAYREVVSEIADEPDYDAALAAAKG